MSCNIRATFERKIVKKKLIKIAQYGHTESERSLLATHLLLLKVYYQTYDGTVRTVVDTLGSKSHEGVTIRTRRI